MKKENSLPIMLFITIIVLLVGIVAAQVVTTVNLSNRINKIEKELKDVKAKQEENSNYNGNNESYNPEEIEYDISAFKEIKGTDIKSESKGKAILVVIARKTCYYCQLYIPILSEVSKEYGIEPRYIDLEKLENIETGETLDQKSVDAIINLQTTKEYEGFMNEYGSTPMTFIVKDNKITNGFVGYTSKEGLIQALKDFGFIK